MTRLASILKLNAEQQKMRKFGDMNRADAILAEEVRPVVLEVLVKDSVSDVEGEKILNLDRRSKSERNSRVDSAHTKRISTSSPARDRYAHRINGSDLSCTVYAWKRNETSFCDLQTIARVGRLMRSCQP